MPATPEPGNRVIAGRYRLVRALGAGGMGTVWQAEDQLLGRPVAVKEVVPPPGVTAEESQVLRERTLREARTAAQLSHPNVVAIYDVVEDGDRPWIVMELLQARSLRDLVQQDGPLPVPEAARVGLQLLAALRAAHRLGIVHRDVKPGNVMIGRDGRVVLADFGIARGLDSPTLTASGMLVGSPSYIAPERARGQRGGPASDLWSLGATLYSAVEGRPPYDRDGALPTLTAVVTQPPDPPRQAGALWPVISGLLRQDERQRLSPDAVETMLTRLAQPEDPRATAPFPAQAGGDLADGSGLADGRGRASGGERAGGGERPDRGALGRAERTLTFHPTAPVQAAPAAGPEPGSPDAAAATPEPAAGLITGPAAEAAAAPPPGPAAGQAAAPAAEPAVEPPPGPAAGQAAAPSAEPAVEPPPGPAAGQAAAPSAEPAVEPPPGPAPGTTGGQPVEPAAALLREAPEDQSAQGPAAPPPEPAGDGPPPAASPAPAAGPALPEPAAGEPAAGTREPVAGAAPGVPAAAAADAREPAAEPAAGQPLAAAPRPAAVLPARAADEPGPAPAPAAVPPPRGPAAPGPRPAPGTAPITAPGLRQHRRRWLLAAAGGAALIAVAAVLALTLPGLLTSPGTPQPRAGGTPAGQHQPSSSPQSPPAAGQSSPAGQAGQPSGQPGVVPAGWHRYRDPTGFSIGVPDGWQVSHQGHVVYVRAPAGGRFLLIDQTTQPRPDPLADWRQQEANRMGTYPGYHRIRLQAVRYPQAQRAADWEFTYNAQDGPTHVLNRNVLANAHHAYALYWSTPAGQWTGSLRLFQVFAATFRPAPP